MTSAQQIETTACWGVGCQTATVAQQPHSHRSKGVNGKPSTASEPEEVDNCNVASKTATIAQLQWQWVQPHPNFIIKMNDDRSVVRRATMQPMDCPAVIGNRLLNRGDYFSVSIESWLYFSPDGCSIGVVSHCGDIEPKGGFARAGRDPKSIGLYLAPRGLLGEEAIVTAGLAVAHPATSTKKPRLPTRCGSGIGGIQYGDVVHFRFLRRKDGVDVLRISINDGTFYCVEVRVPQSFQFPFLPYATLAPGVELGIGTRRLK